MSDSTRTYQTRLSNTPDPILTAYAEVMAHAEHCLAAAIQLGKKANSLKSFFITQFQITARQFNSIRVHVEGAFDSIKQQMIRRKTEKERQIQAIEEFLNRRKSKKVIHQKKRRLYFLKSQLKKLESQLKKGTVSLCFGSRRLFHKQFGLKDNGYDSHEEWKADWKQTRASEIFLLGSKDESGGNQSCSFSLSEDQSITMRLRLPNALVPQFGKYLIIPNVRFAYGHEQIVAAIQNCTQRKKLQQIKDPSFSHYGTSLTVRLKRDNKGWRVFVSTEIALPIPTTSKNQGVVAIDINNNHLAMVESDRFGNPVHYQTIPLALTGLPHNRARALIGDAAVSVINYCKRVNKPLVVENLDFQKKKSQLRERGASYARMLSAFAYRTILLHLNARGASQGVAVHAVNPAYTSLIGRVKFATRYGLSIHHAAALSIGRRFMGLSERMPQGRREIPDGKGGHVALDLPVRNRTRHVWTQWGQLAKRFSAALTAHFRVKPSSSSNAALETEISDLAGETLVREPLASLLSQRT